MATSMIITSGIQEISVFGSLKWEIDSHGGIQVTDRKKKLVYIGDRKDQLEDLDSNVTKAQLEEAKNKSSNWREDPSVLKLLGLDNGYLDMGAFGFIEPNDSILEIETLYSYSSDLMRVGYLTTKRDLMDRIFEAQGTFEL